MYTDHLFARGIFALVHGISLGLWYGNWQVFHPRPEMPNQNWSTYIRSNMILLAITHKRTQRPQWKLTWQRAPRPISHSKLWLHAPSSHEAHEPWSAGIARGCREPWANHIVPLKQFTNKSWWATVKYTNFKIWTGGLDYLWEDFPWHTLLTYNNYRLWLWEQPYNINGTGISFYLQPTRVWHALHILEPCYCIESQHIKTNTMVYKNL